ncbi:unknown [Clostridium sp. CAG:306]|nr:unknown [Clostridium sp. CAG:306]
MISGFGDDVSEAKDVSFAAGETKEITINGKKYKVTNTSTEGNTFQYYYNPLTDQITFGGILFNITITL